MQALHGYSKQNKNANKDAQSIHADIRSSRTSRLLASSFSFLARSILTAFGEKGKGNGMASLDAVRQERSPICREQWIAAGLLWAWTFLLLLPHTSMTPNNLPMTGAQGDAYVASYFSVGCRPACGFVCFLLQPWT